MWVEKKSGLSIYHGSLKKQNYIVFQTFQKKEKSNMFS